MGWDTPEVSPLIYLFIADKKKKKNYAVCNHGVEAL